MKELNVRPSVLPLAVELADGWWYSRFPAASTVVKDGVVGTALEPTVDCSDDAVASAPCLASWSAWSTAAYCRGVRAASPLDRRSERISIASGRPTMSISASNALRLMTIGVSVHSLGLPAALGEDDMVSQVRLLFIAIHTDYVRSCSADYRGDLRQHRGLRGALPPDVHDVVRDRHHHHLLLGVHLRSAEELPADLEVSGQLPGLALEVKEEEAATIATAWAGGVVAVVVRAELAVARRFSRRKLQRQQLQRWKPRRKSASLTGT